MRKLMFILLLLSIALFNLVYAMSGNVLWVEKDYDSWMYVTANLSLGNFPINDGESFELEYDVYVEYYESRSEWAPLAIMQVHLNCSTVNSDPDKYYSIYLFDDTKGNSGIYLQGSDRDTTLTETDNASKYDNLDAWFGKVHRVKIEVDKYNSTNYEVKYYIDGDLVGVWNTSFILSASNGSYLAWKWENFSLNTVCCGVGYLFGSSNPNNKFKMAIDDVRIKLPNGTVIYEDLEDNDWNEVFGRVSYKRGSSNYGTAEAPELAVKAPIPPIAIIIVLITNHCLNNNTNNCPKKDKHINLF